MKILFLTDNFPPEVNAPATRTYEHCAEWVKLGAEVIVITCAPNFPRGAVYEGYRNRLYQSEYVDGIRVIRVWTYIAANRGFAKRSLDYMSFMAAAFLAGLAQRCDVIIATSPQFFTAVAGYLLSLVKRRPWVFELRDLWPESIKAVAAMQDSLVLRLLERLELHLYRRAALVVAVTESFKKILCERGIPADKIAVITNGVRQEGFAPIPKDQALADRLELRNRFVIGYLGTHGMAHGIDFILACAAKIADPQIRFVFIGDGAEKPSLERQCRELNLKNVIMLPPVAKAEVTRYFSVLDASVIPLRRSDTFKSVIPSKIFESAAMGKPMLLGVDGEARRIVENFAAGIFFEPEDELSFLSAIKELKRSEALYRRCRAGCHKLAAAYDRRRLAEEMYNLAAKVAMDGCGKGVGSGSRSGLGSGPGEAFPALSPGPDPDLDPASSLNPQDAERESDQDQDQD